MLRASFGRNLRQLRARRGWSQDLLAAKAGLSGKFLCGEKSISLDNPAHLARALRVPLAAMLKGLKNRKGRPAGSGRGAAHERVAVTRG